jgi:3-oxoacyl-[acyl-carrier protein] reductase
MHDLKGQRALVTGGASGIGLATVRMLLERGATVAVNHLSDDENAMAVVEELAGQGYAVVSAPGNVADKRAADAMVGQAIEALGGLSILVNNAGTAGGPQPIPFPQLDALTEAFWDRILSTNMLGPFWCSRAASAALSVSHGCIVNTASIAGLGRRGSSIAYATSKAGLISLTRSLAVALAPDVRVNAVAPGFVQTEWTKDWSEERRAAARAQSLLQRTATAEDIGDVIVYLATPGSYLNAQTIVVDGGQA